MIINKEYRKKTGDNNSVARSFYSNKNVDINEDKLRDITFDVPKFTTLGGSVNYYSQDPHMLFTNLNVPFIRYEFTGNTHSMSGKTEIVHKTYKLDFESYKGYSPLFNKKETEGVNHENLVTEKETLYDEDGNQISSITKVLETSATGKTENFSKLDTVSFDEIQKLMETPFLEDVVSATGVTTPVYDYAPGQFIKTTGTTSGLYKKELFEDKCQYFVATSFAFYEKTPSDYVDVEMMAVDNIDSLIINSTENENLEYPDIGEGVTATTTSEELSFYESPFHSGESIARVSVNLPEYEPFNSTIEEHSITSTTFNGIVVQGHFFTYFTVPNKPIIEEPLVTGFLNTFSPKIYYSNVGDGDSSVVEVIYNLIDTGFTSSEKFIFQIEKNLNENGIQEAGFPLKTGMDFMYRIGNVKKIRNVFDVDQKIITFSDNMTGRTDVAPKVLFVSGEIDSPFVDEIEASFTPESLNLETPGNYSLSGVVTGSVVTGATLELTYQDGNSIMQVSDHTGGFLFTGLTAGMYTLTTDYRGYEPHVQTINMDKNKTTETGYSEDFYIEILWDNETDTWASKEFDIIKN